ncbi:pentatricopeptide repeat-containing protein At1g63400-like [Spinacia oleracea]|uniref:Pentatricopeptide repeat-containing protein At1g63400-like n=1 Tax=Spinacia oleracea TaxID=3562 RepID=A0ABM3RP37_SPIOL|nr:pentatricopeptide repeat-containing protein At1g63400-like [Spinacia oleracea]
MHLASVLANSYCQMGPHDIGFSLLGKVIKFGYPLDCVIFNTFINCTFINCYIHCDKLPQAASVLLCRIKLSSLDSNSTLLPLVLWSKMEDAEKLLDLMAQNDCGEPNLVCFSTMINGYCKAKNIGKALYIFQQMFQKGKTVVESNSVILAQYILIHVSLITILAASKVSALLPSMLFLL